MALGPTTRVFAASFGYSQCDAMTTFVCLFPGRAVEAARKGVKDEEESSKDSCCQCDEEGHDAEDCSSCSPSFWMNGEHAFSLGDILSDREIREHYHDLIAGNVVGKGGG